MTLLCMIDRLVSISDFSKGKTSSIFKDLTEKQYEYIVLKNNHPTAVLLPVESYKTIKNQAEQFERLLDAIRLYKEENNSTYLMSETFTSINKSLDLDLKTVKQLIASTG